MADDDIETTFDLAAGIVNLMILRGQLPENIVAFIRCVPLYDAERRRISNELVVWTVLVSPN